MKTVKLLVACICAVIIVWVVTSLLDVVIAILYNRFYSSTAFIVSFSVGGIFAAVFGYQYGIRQVAKENNRYKWILVITLLLLGCFFFFFLARLEGGEYEGAFKAFGATLALGSFLFAGNSQKNR